MHLGGSHSSIFHYRHPPRVITDYNIFTIFTQLYQLKSHFPRRVGIDTHLNILILKPIELKETGALYSRFISGKLVTGKVKSSIHCSVQWVAYLREASNMNVHSFVLLLICIPTYIVLMLIMNLLQRKIIIGLRPPVLARQSSAPVAGGSMDSTWLRVAVQNFK